MDRYSFYNRLKIVKERINPLCFYEKHLEGAKISSKQNKGWRQAGLCPFHKDKKSGSFYINQNTGSFKCFSCGSKGSDVISFLRERDGIGFMDALRFLEKEGGLR